MMSITTELLHREAIPVTVGGTDVYCENFRASAVKAVNEETTVNGSSIITSAGIRAVRLTFSGRIYDKDAPLKFLADISGEMDSQPFDVEYRGLEFSDCILQKYEVTDSGKDWTDASFTLITSSEITEEDEQ